MAVDLNERNDAALQVHAVVCSKSALHRRESWRRDFLPVDKKRHELTFGSSQFIAQSGMSGKDLVADLRALIQQN